MNAADGPALLGGGESEQVVPGRVTVRHVVDNTGRRFREPIGMIVFGLPAGQATGITVEIEVAPRLGRLGSASCRN